MTAGTATGETLTAAAVDSVNGFDSPDTVVPKPVTASIQGGRITVTLAPKSVTAWPFASEGSRRDGLDEVRPGSRGLLLLVAPAIALDGEPGCTTSTVILAEGRFYVYGTGNGLPAYVSDDGWTWRRARPLMQTVPGGRPGPQVLAKGGNNTWAPDVIRSGDRYFLYYSAPGTQPKSAIGLLVGKTLDPPRPTTSGRTPGRWSGPTASRTATRSTRACAIPPTARCGSPTGRKLRPYAWCSSIRRPASGSVQRARRPTSRSIRSVDHDLSRRLVYLLVTHGSCCAGANSSYNIRMGGRAR